MPGAGQTVSNPGSTWSGTVNAPYLDRLLKVHRPALAARVDEPHLAVVVHALAPLGAARRDGLPHDATRRPPEPERVVGRVDPVVEAQDEAALLVLHVAVAAAPDPREEHLPLVGDAVAVRVRVQDEVVRVRLVDEDPLVERQEHPRQQQVIDEDRVPVEHAVVLRALVHAHAADRIELAGGIGVAHERPHLGDVHPPVGVEGQRGRTDHVRVVQHELDAVAGRQDEVLRLFFRRQRHDRRLRAVVGVFVRGIRGHLAAGAADDGTAAAGLHHATPAPAAAAASGRLAPRRRVLRRFLGQRARTEPDREQPRDSDGKAETFRTGRSSHSGPSAPSCYTATTRAANGAAY